MHSTEPDRFERLEELVHSLVARYQTLLVEHTELVQQAEERDARILELEEQILRTGSVRADAGKRIDALIAQIDQLDEALAKAAE